MGRPPARLQRVGMCRIERERGATILEMDAGRGINHPRAEPRRVGLDEADRVALCVHDGEVDSAADEGPGGRWGRVRPTGIDPGRQPRRVALREQPAHGDVPERRVRKVRVAIRVDELGGFQLAMDPGGVGPAVAAEPGGRRRLEALEDVEDLEGQDPAAVGRVGRDADAPVGRRDRRRPTCCDARAGPRPCGRPGGGQSVHDLLTEVAVVVGVEPLVHQRAQRGCQRRELHDLARSPRSPRRTPDLAEAGRPRLVADGCVRRLDRCDQAVPGRKARRRVLDRRRQDCVPREAAPAGDGRPPTNAQRPGP